MSNVINIPLGQKTDERTAEVNIGSNAFEVSVAPENLEKIAHICVAVGEEMQKDGETDLKSLKKALKKAYDAIFGVGAFKKIWAESGSIIECSQVLLKVLDQLMNTLPKPTQVQKAQEFVKHKKHKK